MAKIPESCPPVKARTELGSAVLEAEASLRETIALWFTQLLVAIASHVLGRPYHRRRAKVSRRLRREGICNRCGTRKSHWFTRNGFRRRQLLTRWGDLGVDLPRLRCECGGSVRIDFGGCCIPINASGMTSTIRSGVGVPWPSACGKCARSWRRDG